MSRVVFLGILKGGQGNDLVRNTKSIVILGVLAGYEYEVIGGTAVKFSRA
jgi:hypothetical protein